MWELVASALQSKLFWSTALVFAIYLYLKLVTYNYFKKNHIPEENCIIPFGHALPIAVGQKCIAQLIEDSYERYKSKPFHGMYLFYIPHLIINDPDLIRLIMVKDFNYFHDRGLYFNKEVDPISSHLFLLPGEEWKYLRTKLSPTFTSGKIKQMFPLVEKVSQDLSKKLNSCIQKSNNVEIKDILSRYTTDMIASIAFGLECNSLENPNADFRVYGKKSLDLNPVIISLAMFCSKVLDIFKVPLTPKDSSNFFNSVFSDVIKERRTSQVIRKDFLNLLIQLIDHGEVEDDEGSDASQNKESSAKDSGTISMSLACAQAFVFFVAGFETSSSTSTYCLYELALNVGIQEKLRKDIKDTLGSRNKLTYEDVHAMSYLDKVVSETLRKYPILPILNRVCVNDYKIPNTNFCIKKGMNVIIPISALQKDANIYPNPEEFRPERFDSDQIAKRHAFTYLPFGEGPRICIGKRFGLLQVKVALIRILLEFKISVCDKTPIPLKPTKRNVLIMPEGDVFLKLEKL